MIFKQNTSGSFDYIVVGLGNPGSKYENTRHNAGFMVLDQLADKYNVKINKLKFKALIGECTIKQKRILLLKPDTFMNLSGEAVVQAMNFYKISPDKVILAFDDISLPVGKLRVRRKGSHGGQNGVKNIIYLSGSDEFPRVKVGIGAKPHPDYDLANWVLSKFTGEDLKQMKEATVKACEAIELIIENDTEKAMSLFN